MVVKKGSRLKQKTDKESEAAWERPICSLRNPCDACRSKLHETGMLFRRPRKKIDSGFDD